MPVYCCHVGFSDFSGFLHHFVLAKLASSSIRVKPFYSCMKHLKGHDYLGHISFTRAFFGEKNEVEKLIRFQLLSNNLGMYA